MQRELLYQGRLFLITGKDILDKSQLVKNELIVKKET